MKSKILLWLIALVITLIAAYYQRVTGPTYPVSGEITFNNSIIHYKLLRSHGGSGDLPVTLKVPDKSFHAKIFYKRYKTNDNYTPVEMKYSNGVLTGSLPHQPPAGKLKYYIQLYTQNNKILIPQNRMVVVRFKGHIPLWVLIPHILAMFITMLLSTRTGLEYFSKKSDLKKLTYWTIGFLFLGGMILGPIVQKFAFGALWTGVPFGWDLTDNKTLIAMIGWLTAAFMYKRSPNPHKWAVFASVLLIVVYLIPHSVLGSELDYNKLDKLNKIEKVKN